MRDVAPQLYWRLQRRCLCEGCGPAVILAFAEEISVCIYWPLQRRCLCEGSVAPQLNWRLQRRCLCE